MANEKLQRYFKGIVKIISDACTKQVKIQLCKLDEKKFRRFDAEFNNLSTFDSATLFNLVQLFYLTEDLKKIIQQSSDLTQNFSQRFINTQIFFNTIFDINPPTRTYVEVLKKLYNIENLNIELLNSLGHTFRKIIIEFQSLQTPTWSLLEQFKNTLNSYNKTPALQAHFNPMIELIECALPRLSTPTLISPIRASTTPAQ